MSRVQFVRCCIGLAACALGAPAPAQSIDPAGAELALHRPFSLRLFVRSDTPLTAARVAACVEAEFQSGDIHLPADEIRVSVEPANPGGWQWLRFEHPHVVDDPAMLARVALQCPARFEREFVILARTDLPQDTQKVSPPPGPALRTALASGAPSTATRRVEPLAGTAPAPAPAPAPQSNASPTMPVAPEVIELAALRAELAALKTSVAQARASTPAQAAPAPATAPLEPAVSEAWPRPALLGLAATLLATIPLRRRWPRHSRLPRLRSMEIVLPRADEARVPASVAAAAAKAPPPGEHVAVEGRPEPPTLIPPTALPPGAASLADHDAARFTCQVDRLVEDGYPQVAIDLLEKSLDAGPARNPWLLLQLLTLHDRLGHPDRVAQVIAELQTLYRVHLPRVGGVIRVGRGLLEMPELLERLSAAWKSPELIEELEDLIFRVPGPTWDLATFQDLLLLHAVAANRSPETLATPPAPATAAPFEPVLEWTPSDR